MFGWHRVAKFYVTPLNWPVKTKKKEEIYPDIHVGQFKRQCDVDIVEKRGGYGDGVSLRYQRQNNTVQITSLVTFVQVARQHPVWAGNTLTTSRCRLLVFSPLYYHERKLSSINLYSSVSSTFHFISPYLHFTCRPDYIITCFLLVLNVQMVNH